MVIRINAKCSDLCYTQVMDGDKIVFEHDGYVPDFMPDQHFGDYVMLDIDLKTGKILNWDATAKAVKAWINKTKQSG